MLKVWRKKKKTKKNKTKKNVGKPIGDPVGYYPGDPVVIWQYRQEHTVLCSFENCTVFAKYYDFFFLNFANLW